MRITHPALDSAHIAHAWFGVPYGLPDEFPQDADKDTIKTKVRQHNLNALGLQGRQPLFLKQIHSSRVYTATPLFLKEFNPHKPPEGDALVTQDPDTLLAINTADCGPILWHDDKAGIVAATHAGWRGTVAGVIQETFKAMQGLGANPQNTTAVLGPMIHGNSYQVSEDFRNELGKTSALYTPYFLEKDDGLFFDLPGAIQDILKHLNLKSIHWTGQNTGSPGFFSHRRCTKNGTTRGNNESYICIKPKN